MPTEALKQALREVNVAGVERSLAEVIARMFDIPEPLAARVIFALESVKHPVTWHLGAERAADLIPDGEVRRAIREQINEAAVRVHLRGLLLAGESVRVRTKTLVPADKPSRLCEGCPISMPCAAGMISSPEDCLAELACGVRGHVAPVQKAVLVRVTPAGRVVIRVDQPAGEHELSIHDVEF